MKMRDRRGWVAVLAVCGVLALAGCGTIPTSAASPTLTPSTAGGATSALPVSPTPTPSPTSAAPGTPSGTPSVTTTPTTVGPTASASPTSVAPPTEVYATKVSLAADRLSYTRLRWYWGKAAVARCRARHVKAQFEWCNDYYYENTRQKAAGTVAADAVVRILDDDGQPERATVAELPAALADDSSPFYRIRRSGDTITRIEQVYTP